MTFLFVCGQFGGAAIFGALRLTAAVNSVAGGISRRNIAVSAAAFRQSLLEFPLSVATFAHAGRDRFRWRQSRFHSQQVGASFKHFCQFL